MGIWHTLQHTIYQHHYAQFEERIAQIKTTISHRFYAYEQMLRGIESLFAAVPVVTYPVWYKYVSYLQGQNDYPQFTSIFFAKYILDKEKDKYTTPIQTPRVSHYTVQPSGKRPEYLPIVYQKSFTAIDLKNGFDLLTDSNQRAAIERARDTALPSLTKQIQWLIPNQQEKTTGFFLYLPLYYQRSTSFKTVTTRRADFFGVILVSFSMDEFIHDHLNRYSDIAVTIHDSEPQYLENQVDNNQLTYNPIHPYFFKVIYLEIGGQLWQIRLVTLPHSNTIAYHQIQYGVFISGLIMSLLLAGMTGSFIKTRRINSRLQTEINKRIRLEKRLRNREKLLRLVIDSIPQYIFWKDLNQVYLGCNQHFATLTGAGSPAQIVGKTDSEITWPVKNYQNFHSVIQQVLARNSPEYHTIEILQLEGKPPQWLDIHLISLQDCESQIMGILVTFADITEQKLAEQALKQAHLELHQFKTTLDMAPDGVFIREADTLKLSYVNQGMTKLFGYTETELLQTMPGAFNPEISEQQLSTLLNSLRNGSQPAITFETVRQHQNGSVIPIEISLQYIEVPEQLSRFIGIVRDITERKQAQTLLQQAIETVAQVNIELSQFKMTLDMTLDIVLMRDANTLKFTYANQGAVKQLGYTQAELLQLTPVQLTPEFTPDSLRAWLAPLVTGSQSAMTFETVAQHKAGHLIPVEIFVQYIKVPGVDRFISIARDITERKQAEIALLQAKKLAESAKQEAEIANRAKSIFLANMSHELRTPLNSILGYAQILSRDSQLTAKQQEGVDIIQRSGDYLLTLINDILDLAKIEAGKIELWLTDFNFIHFIQSITDLFSWRAQQKGISFRYEALSHLPKGVRTDEKRLRQILINLLGNAIKFTDKGGVTLKMGYHNQRIRFQIEDTGIGIAPDELDRIFTPFQQVGDPHYWAQGTGLGLAITKNLIEIMGGKLAVESTFQRGSTFWFALDLPDVSDLMKKEPHELQVIIGFEGTARKILVVDDKWENRSVIINLLTPLGFEIIEANHGQEGLTKAQALIPDLIITDLVMPVLDGFELIRQLRKIPQLKKIPIIVVSASVFETDQLQSFQAGCDDFLAKPIRADILLDRLQNYLNLQWIYEPIAPPTTSGVNMKPVNHSVTLITPPLAQLVTLYDLAMQGDISGIMAEIDKLEPVEPQWVSFCRQIRQLAKNFEEEKICQLLEQYMNDLGAQPPN
ncbi:signal transduction histidine kinase [Thioploca ingrica]|uniref:histidine kinase n=1 Tax=Thioploca ingrica TaxID=40754 RepID=A0A090AIR5_9GAMM|nr:signal transduction histidine kinase [Thioploca ingrica]